MVLTGACIHPASDPTYQPGAWEPLLIPFPGPLSLDYGLCPDVTKAKELGRVCIHLMRNMKQERVPVIWENPRAPVAWRRGGQAVRVPRSFPRLFTLRLDSAAFGQAPHYQLHSGDVQPWGHAMGKAQGCGLVCGFCLSHRKHKHKTIAGFSDKWPGLQLWCQDT